MSTYKKIIEYIKEKGPVTGAEMADAFGISRQALYKHLRNLLENEEVVKIGKPPKVFYSTKKNKKEVKSVVVDEKTKKIIDESYLIITPSGERMEGARGFIYWCEKNNLPVKKTAAEYLKTISKYDNFKQKGIINGMRKMKSAFKKVFLDELFFLDFYSIERFGKTKLGQILLYAKQSQNKKLIKELISEIKPRIFEVIRKYKIESVGFIPPTVKREVQFMRELERNLNLSEKKIKISKIKTDITVPQKTLSKLDDRVENAKRTIVVEDARTHKNILLIDDAVGSGATLNEIAAQIKNKKLCSGKIIGLAITGSFKGFDVISEV